MRNAWKWYHGAAIAGAAVGTVALLWWLSREEGRRADDQAAGGSKRSTAASETAAADALLLNNLTAENATKAQVLQILQRVVDSQEEVRKVMRDVTRSLLERPTETFPEVYTRVSAVIPEDPLETAGISMLDFDAMLERFSSDAEVRSIIERIMGMPSSAAGAGGSSSAEDPASSTTTTTREISKEEVIEIHNFMLEQLRAVVNEVRSSSDSSDAEAGAAVPQYDLRTLTVAAQALVSAQVLQKFGVTSEAVEKAIFQHQEQLTLSIDFTRVNMEIQATMGELVGQWPSSGGGGGSNI